MRNWINTYFAISIMLVTQNVVANSLIEFKNGDVANAEDINSNFKELEKRIVNIPVGSVESVDGMVVNFSDYKHQYKSKTFSVTGRADSFDREIWEFMGPDWTVVQKFLATSDLTRKSEKYTDRVEENANGDYLFVSRNRVIPKSAGIVIAVPNGSFTGIRSGILLAKKDMVVGHAYSSGGIATNTTYSMGITLSNRESSYIDTVIPVAIESVIAGNVEYQACLKMERRRKGLILNEYDLFTLSWYCPGEGLVKQIRFIKEFPAGNSIVETDVDPVDTGEVIELIAKELTIGENTMHYILPK